MCNQLLINRLMYYVNEAGYINVVKTNMPSKQIKFSPFQTSEFKYKNIKTTINSKQTFGERIFMVGERCGEKVINWSNAPCFGYGVPKIIMALKMYGMPFLDISGEYGISNRDNYVVSDYNTEELKCLLEYLSLNFIQDVFDTTRYRMRYLEKYAFQFIPDITNIADINENDITNKTIEEYFCINQ